MEYDVVIIGAGPAGITLANHLSKDLNVALIEKGDSNYSTSINTNDYGVCKDYGNYPFHNYSSNFSSVNSVGGNSLVWSGWTLPFEDKEIESWPIDYSEMKKYYSLTEKFLNLKNFDHVNKKNNEIYNKFIHKNWKINTWQFMQKKNFNQFIKKLNPNIKIFSKTEFKHFKMNQDKIEGVYVNSYKKEEFYIKGKFIVLAQGALQTTKTLLLTEKKLNVKMGNENGHLGKFYMEHPHINLGHFYDKNKFLKDRFKKKNFELPGLFLKKPYRDGILNGCITFNSESLLLNQDAIRLLYILRLKKIPKNIFKKYSIFMFIINLIRGTYNFIKEKLNNKKFIYARFEQAPDINSSIELDENDKIKLNWKISFIDINSICKITKMVEQYVKDIINKDVYIDKSIYDVSNWQQEFKPKVLGIGHHMGTTIMSDKSNFGVVNKNLKLHYRDNLFLCSSSVFPTGGVAHPTFTICALAIRLADHLNKILSDQSTTS